MHQQLLVFLALASSVSSVSFPCTDPTGRFLPTATACPNKSVQSICDQLFPIFKGTPSSKFHDPAQATAAANCRKNCMTCCLDPDYSCSNPASSVDCSLAVCHDFPGASLDLCPATCGLCTKQRCTDSAVDCAVMKSLCRDTVYGPEVRVKCASTCGLC